MIRTVSKLVAPLKRRVLLMIGRAVLQLVNDSNGIQVVQIVALNGEVLDQVERFQQYGFTSVPHPGAEGVLAAAAGDRAHGLIVATEDRRYRLKNLAGGEMAIYDDLGQKVHLKRDGIRVETPLKADVVVGTTATLVAPVGVRVETPEFTVTGEIKDRCDTDGRTMASMRDVYNDHVHPENDSGGPTSAPTEAM
jgi:phage baseplate assembly protein V